MELDNQDFHEPIKKLEFVEQERDNSSSSENEENDIVNNQGTNIQPCRSRLPLAMRRLADYNTPPNSNNTTDDVFITN